MAPALVVLLLLIAPPTVLAQDRGDRAQRTLAKAAADVAHEESMSATKHAFVSRWPARSDRSHLFLPADDWRMASAVRTAGQSGVEQPPAAPGPRLVTVDVAGMATMQHLPPSAGYCDGFVTCRPGALTPGGMVAMRASSGRVAVRVEVMSSRQVSRSRSHPLADEAIVFRATRGTVLVGYRFTPSDRLSYAVLGGGSHTVGDAKGAIRIKGAMPPLGGRYEIADRDWALGVTGGGDVTLSLGGRLSLVVPVRLTWTVEQRRPATWPSTVDVQIGAGLSLRVLERRR